MKIKMIIASLAVLLGLGVSAPQVQHIAMAEEITETEQGTETGTGTETEIESGTEVETELPCKVILKEYEFGNVYVDKEEGEIGEIVTLHATPSLLCKVVEVSVNGMILTAGEDGNYTFVLVEGDNVVNAKFEVSNEDVANILELIKSFEGKSFDDLFTFENLLIIIAFLLVTVFGSGLLIQLLKNKNSNKNFAKDLNDSFNNNTLKTIHGAVESFLQDRFGPAFDKISDEMKSLDNVARTMANCFMLSQENTPEARIAIAKELAKLSEIKEDLAKQVEKILYKKLEEKERKEEDKKKAIEDLEKSNNEILNDSNNTEGRY